VELPSQPARGHCSELAPPVAEPPSVDVIIPVRNRAALVPACLASIQAQTLQPSAVIVVDDGSSDGTPEIVEEYRKQMPALHLVRSEARGVSHARNVALSMSRAPFIAFLDSDDVWLPEKLERQMALFAAAGTQLGLVHCALVRIDESGKRCPGAAESWPSKRGSIFEDMIRHFYHIGSPSAVVVRRDLIEKAGGFDETLLLGEDTDLWLRMARMSQVDYVPAVLVGLRAHSGGTFGRAIRGNPEFVLFQRLKIWNKWAADIGNDGSVLAQFRSEAIYVSMANMLRRRPQFGLYRRLKRSELPLARRLFAGPLTYLQPARRLRIAYGRTKGLAVRRLILPNPALLRLCQLAGRLKRISQASDYNRSLDPWGGL
jgi:glycosyltransferase involved in cell wall biosynthesis